MFCACWICWTDRFQNRAVRRFPDADTPTDQPYDLPNADAKDKEAVFQIIT